MLVIKIIIIALNSLAINLPFPTNTPFHSRGQSIIPIPKLYPSVGLHTQLFL